MKKLSVILFALAGALVLVFSGCSNGGTFSEKSYSSGESEIVKVTVNVEDRELEVTASEDDRIYIDYFDSEKEYLDIKVSEDKELTVNLTYNKEWTDFIGTKPSAQYRKIRIRIPDNKITSFTANTTNGDIKVSALSFTERITLGVNGGDIEFECINVGKSVSLTAKNGDITGSLIGGWDDFSMQCTIKKGDCNLPSLKEGGEKSFTADCNNGDINVEFVK